MPELRWILGLIGIGVLIALYVRGRLRAAQPQQEPDSTRVEPSLEGQGALQAAQEIPDIRRDHAGWSGGSEPDIGLSANPQLQTDSADQLDAAEDDQQNKILVLYVRATRSDFLGPQLLEAFRGEGLEFGKYGAFHLAADSGEPVFSVADMVEPGSFPEDDMDSFATGGMTIFMVLPGPAGIDGLARMIACARKLANILGGEVLDETGSTLTNQRATHMREEAIEFLRKTRIEAVDSGSPWRH
jgi:cell division protein ZipA